LIDITYLLFEKMPIPIQTLHLFPLLNGQLTDLLKSLSASEWNNSTLASQWTVKDIVTHLVDGNLRVLSMIRDGYFGDPPGKIASYQDLVDYLNRLNADWVKATRRLSPGVLIELLETTDVAYHEQLSKLDPLAPAMFAVSWAGQTESPNWFHVAREYTEKWHHQQQIRVAVNKPGLMDRKFFNPLIDTFMQALPHTYRTTDAAEGTVIQTTVTTEAGGDWWLVRSNKTWMLKTNPTQPVTTHITLDPDTAWKLFTKGISRDDASKKIQVSGNRGLGEPILSMLAVMA
jgi:uncharacterized protein (TIGR03083 family)